MSFHPQTPQSPSQPSPMTSDTLPSLASSMTSITSALPTPAHSVNGCPSQPFDMSQDMVTSDDLPQKRKRALEDTGDREQKKMHLGESKLGIDDLHLDVGPKYLLGSTRISFPQFPTSKDLFETFDLAGLAAEMAREKPSGEKNTLRKSFKGQLKRLVIDGGYDTKKDERDENDPDGFFAMLSLPEDVWYAHHVKQRDIADGLSESTLACLPKSMTMLKGKVRKDHWDPYILGALESTPAQLADPMTQANSAKPTEPNTPAASTPAAMGRAKPSSLGPHPSQDPSRPRRNIKKRSYGDSSFEGYGEGFPDDDTGVDTGYSTGDGENGGGQKRRKKNLGSAQPAPMQQQSYGPGMIGA